MESNSAAYVEGRTPLLVKYQDSQKDVKRSILPKIAKMTLLGLMRILFLGWIALLILYPTQFFKSYIKTRVAALLSSSFFRITGYSVILYSLPLFLIVILGTIYLQLQPEKTSLSKEYCGLSQTQPVLANTIVGIVSSADLGFILAFVLYTGWCFYAFLSHDLSSSNNIPSNLRWRYAVAVAGERAGEIGLIFLGFLFLPVARGSVLLRLIDVPFEHAVKYHIWLGHWMMILFTFHGIAFVIYWAYEGEAWSMLTSWDNFAILPGVISLLAGWAIWVTSLPPVRPRSFELFFYTHQLYAIFIIFMALHAADLILGLAVGGILFFMLDRFLRFCQSRKAAGVHAARVLPCGSIELILDKPASLRYHALSFIFLNVPKLSWLQWHPFSVSSSPFDGNNHIAILIKPLGHWTRQLQAHVKELTGDGSEEQNRAIQLSVAVEGPYGHESDYYLRYKKLFLVAGGIGISPFVAILRDILHRHEHFESDLPEDVILIWAVKKSKELHLLDLVDPVSICPQYTSRLNLRIRAYVTQELQPDSEWQAECIHPAKIDAMTSKGKSMSDIVATNNNYWFLLYILISMVGYGITVGLFGSYLVTDSYSSSPLWLRGGYVALSMLASVIVFGGLVVGTWSIASWKSSYKSMQGITNGVKHVHGHSNGYSAPDNGCTKIIQPQNLVYGARPNFGALFEEICKEWTGTQVGALVCGPISLQASVATECRASHQQKKGVTFHYHSLSFDL